MIKRCENIQGRQCCVMIINVFIRAYVVLSGRYCGHFSQFLGYLLIAKKKKKKISTT